VGSQAGFDQALPGLVGAARQVSLATLAQQGSFTCGPLGWFTERLADAGLVALATVVAPAVLAAGPGTGRVFGTNPMAWSVPRAGQAADRRPGVERHRVSLGPGGRRAGRPLSEGWAVDADGHPTTDAEAALAGALLTFGGYKGANIALLVELLSSMAGGSWSTDAPPWDSGSRPPSVGMFVLALITGPSGRSSRPVLRSSSTAWPPRESGWPATAARGRPPDAPHGRRHRPAATRRHRT
jgi:(2R)-3-sulfolactate dehydrogenase (NADP+)